jgi:beta-glucanase (GH16 family)
MFSIVVLNVFPSKHSSSRHRTMRGGVFCCLLSILIGMTVMTGCGGSQAPLPAQSQDVSQTASGTTQAAIPTQPAPVGSAQFSMFGFTWAEHASPAPGNGTYSKSNVAVSDGQVVLTLNEDSSTSVGAEIATVTPLSYGTYTFTYYQDVITSGSVASGFSYIKKSITEIDVEQQGQFPQRWDFTNWLTVDARNSTFVDGYNATKPHKLEYVWQPGRIRWYIDGQQVADHAEDIPSEPAPFLFNFWGTNNSKWGGVSVPGQRHMIISGFNYQPS